MEININNFIDEIKEKLNYKEKEEVTTITYEEVHKEMEELRKSIMRGE